MEKIYEMYVVARHIPTSKVAPYAYVVTTADCLSAIIPDMLQIDGVTHISIRLETKEETKQRCTP